MSSPLRDNILEMLDIGRRDEIDEADAVATALFAVDANDKLPNNLLIMFT